MAKRDRSSFSLSVLAFLAVSGSPWARGQVAEGIRFPTYYEAHELAKGQTNRLKMLITCKTAELQPNSALRLGEMLLEHYDGYGRTNLIASSPECIFNQAHKTVSSAAKLKVNADGGLLFLEGVGFFCTLTNTALTLSNNVETRIREDIGTQLRTNRSRSPVLTGSLAATATAGTGAYRTNASASTNYITILSDRMFFALASNTVTYLGAVRVSASQFEMTCQQLDGKRATNGTLENIIAQYDVVLFNKADGSSAYGERAVYQIASGNEMVLLSGDRARWQDASREALARNFSFDLKEQRFRAEGNAYFKLPRMSIGQQSLLAGKSSTATNSVAQGDVEITAELVIAQLPTTNNPARSVSAMSNVVIVSTGDKSRATGDEFHYSEASGILEVNGRAFWQTDERIISGDTLFADRSNRVFAVNGNAFMRLPASDLGRQGLLSPFLSGHTNAPLASAPSPQYLEMRCQSCDYRADTLTFRQRVRGAFLEGTNGVGAMTCELLLLRFNTNRVESATAKDQVHVEQFPYVSTNGATVSKSLDCEALNVLLTTNGFIRRVLAETNVFAVQVERSKTNALPVASSLRAQLVVGNFFTDTNRLRELVAIKDVALAHDTRKANGQRAVYNVTNNTVELTGNPTADFPDGNFSGKITEAEALVYDVAQKKFVVIKPRAQGERAAASTNQSNLPFPK
jgi:lipopolysaccharide export system protein LptA